MSGSEILFIAHRMPFPPNRGDKIRSHHVLKRLARLAPVHVACFADDEADLAEEVELASLAHSYRLVRRTKGMALAGIQALTSGRPVSVTAFHDERLADYVRETLASGRIGTIFVYSGQMGHYVPADFGGRVIVDFCDVDSVKFEAYAEREPMPMCWVHAREARLLRAEEGRLAASADASLLISAKEAELFASRLSPAEQTQARVRVLGNGIDSAFFDPAQVRPRPELAELPGPRLIFTGQMDYPPNVAAVERVSRRIMPRIREALPEASFHVVGRNPTPAVKALHGVEGTHVWGRVDDVRPWLAGASLALVPLEIARGVQNKVLEAMAMAVPVVLTEEAATGINGVAGHHYAVADSDQGLAEAVLRLARDPVRARIKGRAGRRFAVERQSWQSALAPLTELVAGSGHVLSGRDAA